MLGQDDSPTSAETGKKKKKKSHLCWQKKDKRSLCRKQIFTAGVKKHIYFIPKAAKIMQENPPHLSTIPSQARGRENTKTNS